MPLRLRRGTEANRTSITPVQGEPIYTTDTKKFFIGDGVTPGGVEFNGTSGTSGVNGTSGTSGVNGTSGTSGVNGTSGTSGVNGTSGTTGTSGTSGVNGTSGTSGVNGTSGTSGANGTSGTSGANGANGTSGTSGADGSSGTSGANGTSGTSGSGFTTINNSSVGRILLSDGTTNAATASSNLSWNSGNETLDITNGGIEQIGAYTSTFAGDVIVTGTLTATASIAVSASFASTASYWSGTVTSASYAQTATTASYSYQQFVNVQTLSGTKTILSTDPSVQILNPNGATRTVVLPTNVPTGSKFEIWNSGIDSSNNYLSVGDGVYYIYRVDPGKKITVRFTGVDIFTGPGYPWTIDGETAVSIADNYDNYSYAVGIGYAASNNRDYGIGIGRTAQNNYTNGVGIGFEAQNNYSYGVGTGYSAYNNYTYGIGIGYYAYNNNSNGIGIGKNAYSNYSSGIGIGENASSNYNYGVGIGQNTQNNYNYGVSIGAVATSNAKGTGTVAIGAYSKAERQNEFVTTGTGISTNQAQSIIQKFRNKSLATAAGAFQEIFTDAGSGRLTILASSIYHFRIQINAIEATGFKCKTWEITGAVKRDASNNTTMVGGAPTYYITSEDSGTGNWDVKASANDTNEALKIEVKHDSANNVTFSATVWATETRL